MAGVAGYKTTVKIMGTATAMTNEAMSTHTTVANTFRVTDPTKRIFQRGGSYTVKVGTTTVAGANVTNIDYINGRVTLNFAPIGSVNITGNYLPVASVAGANSYTMAISNELGDDTDYSSQGYRSRKPLLKDVTVTVARWDNVDVALSNLIVNDTLTVLEINPGNQGAIAKGYFRCETDNRSGGVDSFEQSDMSFVLDGDENGSFSFEDQ